MLMPKKVKYRKQQRGRRRGKAWRGGELSFGEYGLKALEPAWITDRQIEASRVAITRFIKRGGKLWIRIFPDKPFTKKPAETRMGKGKGAPERWVAVVKPGRVMFEMAGVDLATATQAMELAAHKLPIHTKFVTRAGEPLMPQRSRKIAGSGHAGTGKRVSASWPSRSSACVFSSPPARPKRWRRLRLARRIWRASRRLLRERELRKALMETAVSKPGVRTAAAAQRTGRRGDQRQDAEDHRGAA